MNKLFENAKGAVNVCFEMHNDLSPVANVLVKTAMSMVEELGTKVFTMTVPSFIVFRDVVHNLLNDFQPC